MNSQKQKTFLFILITVLLVIAYHIPREWVFSLTDPICIHKSLFGFGCPFCGMTRAIYEIVHLNFHDAFNWNFSAFPFIITCLCWVLYVFTKNTAVKKITIIMACITAVCFTVTYALRIAGSY